MSDEQTRRLIRIKPKLLKVMQSFNTGLCGYLLSKRIVSEVDLDRINSKTTCHDRNDEIIEAVLRRSGQDLANFKTVLIEDNQAHVASYLDEGKIHS